MAKTFTLKNPKPMGEADPKYGQSYWSYTHDSDMPVMFNLMDGDVADGSVITAEEWVNKESSKGTEYQRLRKVKVDGQQTMGAVRASTKEGKWQPRDDLAIRAQWAIGQAVQLQIPYLKDGVKYDIDGLEQTASELFAMVDRVKTGSTNEQSAQPSLKDEWDKATAKPDVVDNDIGDEPINLDAIPF